MVNADHTARLIPGSSWAGRKSWQSNLGEGMNGEPAGSAVSVGHWRHPTGKTGCTVIFFDRLLWATVDVRGAAPGTRETDLLHPGHLVQRADAIVLSGGSAFGLAAADGVVRVLAQQRRGFPMRAQPVPIVPAAVIYDLGDGDPVWPDAAAGEAACQAARPLIEMERGQVGVGTAATTGKLWGGPSSRGGIGYGWQEARGRRVSAVVVVNAVGDVTAPHSGRRLLNPAGDSSDRRHELLVTSQQGLRLGEATTLAVVIVEHAVDQMTLTRCAIAAHDGLARVIRPAHTIYDGDLVFAVTTVAERVALTVAEILPLSVATELAVEAAVVDAVTS